MKLNDRIKSLRRVKGSDLIPHPKNWRTHSDDQKNLLRGVLSEIGIVDVLIARETKKGLQLIDGHMRADDHPDTKWPVLVLDVTEEEAKTLLGVIDPIGEQAGVDKEKQRSLAAEIETECDALTEMLADIGGKEKEETKKPELEISPELHERQDYLVITFDNEFDWLNLCQRLGVKTVTQKPVDPKSTIQLQGIGRVVKSGVLLELLEMEPAVG